MCPHGSSQKDACVHNMLGELNQGSFCGLPAQLSSQEERCVHCMLTSAAHGRKIVMPVQVALLNSMYGDGNAGFGTRRIRAGSGSRKALLEGAGPQLFAGAKARKGGARKSTIQCKACGQVGALSQIDICIADCNLSARLVPTSRCLPQKSQCEVCFSV